jgi:hypothetical protein
MKMKGSVVAVLRSIETGEITKTVESSNHIQDEFLRYLLSRSTTEDFYDNIFVSSVNTGYQTTGWTTGAIGEARVGATISGVAAIETTQNASPNIDLKQIVKRFVPPAEDTEINTIGVCNGVSLGLVTTPCAVVWLNETLIQTPLETLDIYYRLQVVRSPKSSVSSENSLDVSFSPHEQRVISGSLIGLHGVYSIAYNYPVTGGNSTFYPAKSAFSKLDLRNYDTFEPSLMACSSSTANIYESSSGTYYKATYGMTFIPAENVGDIITWLAPHFFNMFSKRVKSLNGSPVQGIFGHRSTSTGPFYSPSNSQLGLGSISVNGDNWTDPDLPEFYKVDIVTSGVLGVSEYKFIQQKTLGFSGNGFGAESENLPFTAYPNAHLTDGFPICRDSYLGDGPDNYAYLYAGDTQKASAMSLAFEYEPGTTKVMFLWVDSFCITEILTGETQAFDNTKIYNGETVPTFLPTDIRQRYVTAGKEIYIACGDTGLYKFNAALDTLTVIDSNIASLSGTIGCLGVCEGNAGRIWAFFEHSTTPDIYYSDDSGLTWVGAGFNNAAITSTPKVVVGLQADKNAAGGQLAVIHYNQPSSNSTQEVYHTWWDQATTTATPVTTRLRYKTISFNYLGHWAYYLKGHDYYFGEALVCSPNQSQWNCVSVGTYGGRPVKFVFGGGSSSIVPTSALTSCLNTTYVIDKDGDDAIFYAALAGENGGDPSGSGLTSCSILVKADHSAVEICPMTGGVTAGFMYLRDGLAIYRKQSETATSSLTDAIRGINFNHWGLVSVAPRRIQERDYSSYPGICGLTLPDYGWDGAQWVRGHPGAKPTHAGLEEIIEGITVSFDDKGGVSPFLDSDHYTFTMVDGVFLDGSTSFSAEWNRYIKEVEVVTDMESATLPAALKVSNNLVQFLPQTDADFVDRQNMNTDALVGKVLGTGNGLIDSYTGLIRSANPVFSGSAVSFLPNNTNYNVYSNVQGALQFTVFNDDTSPQQAYIGLSNSSVLGTVLDPSTIQYAFLTDSQAAGSPGNGRMRVSVVESGIERAFVENIPYDRFNDSVFSIILLNNGKMVYQYSSTESPGWTTLYESPAIGTVDLVDYYFDMACVPRSNYGLELVRYFSLDETNPDYYTYIGNGVDTGIFDPFYRITDPNTSRVFIDGVEAVNVGTNDTATDLQAGNYAMFNEGGVIRYSSADIGKTVSVEAYIIKDEFV